MSRFTQEQLRQRAFKRAAWVLRHFWEEQQDDPKREASVDTRLFDKLVPRCHIEIGTSQEGGGHIEHLVPCIMLRDHAFKLFWKGKDENKDISEIEQEVAEMLGQFLRIAHITPAEAHHLDHVLGLKTKMPDGWDFEKGSVMDRLEKGDITLVLKA